MTGPAYRYSAVVVRVVDGDGLVVSVDLGWSVWLHSQRIRLAGCNARELPEPGGVEARDHLAELLPAGTAVTLATVKIDRYGGRYDAHVTLPDGRDLVSLLIAAGWAAPWDGRGPRPVPLWPRPKGVA
jgi:endonuclease YncB( thermonuclease family)